MPPVGKYVSSLSVIRERVTGSYHGPSTVHRDVHTRCRFSLVRSRSSGSR